jgi:hypothetical protein
MNHLRHAPESHSGASPGDPVSVTFASAVVKVDDTQFGELPTSVPFAFRDGITTRLRAFSPTGSADDVVAHCQVAPDNAPFPPGEGDEGTGDPYQMKETALGTITVSHAGRRWTLRVTSPPDDGCSFDLTRGIDVRYSLQYDPQTAPIGPLLDIDVTPIGDP